MVRANRDEVFDSKVVGVYHCVHRAVRRAWLCGWDELTGKSYEHRKQWVEDQMIKLSSIFGFDMLAYAIMDNHVHLVTRNRPDILELWSDREVALRWWRLCPKRKEADGTAAIPTPEELAAWMVPHKNIELRARLGSVSWLMRYLAEPIARRANREDECTGHFWEGRFKCQRLLDEAGLLACCAYVELNPVRAGAADLPEKCKYTSIYKRITAQIEEAAVLGSSAVPVTQESAARAQQSPSQEPEPASVDDVELSHGGNELSAVDVVTSTASTAVLIEETTELEIPVAPELRTLAFRSDAWLAPVAIDAQASAYAGPMPSKNSHRASDKGFLEMTTESYIKLIDWVGRQTRGDRRVIPEDAAPILKRIGLDPESFCELVHRFGKIFKQAAGRPASLVQEAARRKRRWIQCHDSPLADIAASTG